jgi:hypothetical protein
MGVSDLRDAITMTVTVQKSAITRILLETWTLVG